jgi:phenylpropionate dioxygenase-like ring-hydroxylating dioxygenase large terminal subunit
MVMIPNQWYAVLESNEVKRGRPVGTTRLGEKMVFWRDRLGRVAALRDLCPHRGAALSAGEVVADHVGCPFHGFRFDASGKCQLIPANGRAANIPAAFQVKAFPTREAHGFIWVWWGEAREELPPLPFFEDLDRTFTYASFRDHWPVHYTRAIENQLDVVHLPFVHHNTIGRGGRLVVDGPLVELEGDELRAWVYNRPDDGTPARRANELAAPERPPFLYFRFPSIWQLRIAEQTRIFVAFAPIDEENTMLYVRYYHRFTRLPLLRQLVAQAGRLSSIVIVRQDKRVVVTQRPKKVDITLREKLIPGDRPIVLYRARRKELIEAQAGS